MKQIKIWIKVFTLLLLTIPFLTTLQAGLAKCYAIPDNALTMHYIIPDPDTPPTLATAITIAPNVAYGSEFSGEGGALSAVTDKVYLFECDAGDDNGDVDMWSVNTTTGATTLEVADIISNSAPAGDNRDFQGCMDGALFYINPAKTIEILYVIGDNDGTNSARRLYAFDPQNSFDLMAGYPVNLFGDRNRLDSIEYDATVDKFYGANDGTAGIYEVNITTGETTFTTNTASSIDAEAMGYGSDFRLYVEDEIGGGVVEIFSLNPDTGTLTSAATYNNGGADVETIACNVGEEDDLSDAPNSYGVAAHNLPTLSVTPHPVYMGVLKGDDDKLSDIIGANADSDDNDGNNDDDGATVGGIGLQDLAIGIGSTITIDIATNGAVDGILNAWIDFNHDGDFLDAGEQIATDLAGTTGSSIALLVAVPITAVASDTYVRLRYSTVAGLTAFDDVANGVTALDGEVEDYKISLVDSSVYDMNISKTSVAEHTPALPGDIITYTIVVENNVSSGGPVNQNVVLKDILPTGVTYAGGAQKTYPIHSTLTGTYTSPVLTADVEPNTNEPETIIFDTTGLLPTGAILTSYSLHVVGTANAPSWRDEIDLTATYPTGTAYSLDFGDDLGFPSSAGAYDVTQGPLAVSGTAIGLYRFIWSEDYDDAGINNSVTSATFTITYEYTTTTITTDAANAPVDMVTGLDNVDLYPGEQLIVEYNVTVDANVSVTILTNTATASTSIISPISDTAVDSVTSSADLVTTKIVNNASPQEGDTITYTLAVTNNGPRTATNTALTDILPAGVTYVSSSPSQGTYNAGTGLWDIGTVNNAAIVELNITVTVD